MWLAARLVPKRLRDDWLREWRAEIEHHDANPMGLRRTWAALPDAWAVHSLSVGTGVAPRPKGTLVNDMKQDVTYALRSLRRAPGYTATTILVLALGIGANAAMFSVVNAVLLQPLPFPEPDRLAVVWERHSRPGWEKARITVANYLDLKRLSRTFEGLAFVASGGFTLTGAGEPVQLGAARVSHDYFDVLGIRPLLGRPFTEQETLPGGGDVVILGHGLWQGRFAGDPGVVGRTIELDDTLFEIVGVMPPGRLPAGVSMATMPLRGDDRLVFVPMVFTEQWVNNRRTHVFGSLGRLRPGATLEEARRDLQSIADGINGPEEVLVESLHEETVGSVRAALWLLFGAVGFVLLVACANVAGIAMARGVTRMREAAIRASLGAGRSALLRQFLVENVILALAGGAVGALLAAWSVSALRATVSLRVPRMAEAGLDPWALGFVVALALLTGLAFGLAPASRLSGARLAAVIREGGASVTGPERQGSRHGLVVAQIGLAVTLVVGAGLMAKSLWTLQGVDPGFRPEGVLEASLALPSSLYPEQHQVLEFWEALAADVAGLPGVTATAVAYESPLSATWSDAFVATGHPLPDGSSRSTNLRIVSSGYLRALGLPLRRGRGFDSTDRPGAPGVALVNEAFVRVELEGADPIGEELQIGTPARFWPDLSPSTWEIVGVVGDVGFSGPGAEPEPAIYLPFEQFPLAGASLLVHTEGDPAELGVAVREAVWRRDADRPILTLRALTDQAADLLADQRFAAQLAAGLSIVALLLAAVGLYGLMAFAVAQRRREIGVRLALGATESRVLGIVIRQGLALTAVGIVAGLLASVGISRLLAGFLYEVSATDASVLGGVAVTLLVVAAGACLVPGVRASRVDPVVALRQD